MKNEIGFKNTIGIKNKGKSNEAYHVQLSNKNLYEFLVGLGLTPAKSLNQKELQIPDEYFIEFYRGVIDGDGSIRNWKHSSNKTLQWSLRIYSPSIVFLQWL